MEEKIFPDDFYELKRGIKEITAEFISTNKNMAGKSFYENIGFSHVEDKSGSIYFRDTVSAIKKQLKKKVHI